MRVLYCVAELPYPPSANRYWRVWRGRPVMSSEARAYKAQVAALLRDRQPETGPVALEVEVIRPAKRGDLDNSLKVLLDALKGTVFEDDQQVVELHAWRLDRKRKGAVVVRAFALREDGTHDVG